MRQSNSECSSTTTDEDEDDDDFFGKNSLSSNSFTFTKSPLTPSLRSVAAISSSGYPARTRDDKVQLVVVVDDLSVDFFFSSSCCSSSIMR